MKDSTNKALCIAFVVAIIAMNALQLLVAFWTH
jgi:hypothetical protein